MPQRCWMAFTIQTDGSLFVAYTCSVTGCCHLGLNLPRLNACCSWCFFYYLVSFVHVAELLYAGFAPICILQCRQHITTLSRLFTYVTTLSMSNIIWYQPWVAVLYCWESDCGLGGKTCCRVHNSSHLRIDGQETGISSHSQLILRMWRHLPIWW